MSTPRLDRPLFSLSSLRTSSSEPELILIGVDYHGAALDLREKVAYNQDDGSKLLDELLTREEIAEACLLSTCNRTELYLRAADLGDDGPHPEAYRAGLELTFLRRAPEIENEGRFYVKRDHEAARHLLEVASGLESMVLGEPEILGQVKQAANLAAKAGTSGKVLQRLLRTAINASGRARQETAIAAGSVSFGYAVVDLARNIFQRLEDCSVLLVGAGETARLVARNLLERGADHLWVTNRGQGRSDEFCRLFPAAKAVPFEERDSVLPRCDVIVASTAAEEAVVTRRALEHAMRSRRARPLLVVDLGVPRNVEPGAGEIDNLFLQDIDSLENLIARNLKKRRDEIPKVQEILEHEHELFVRWCRGLAAEPLVESLQRQAEQTRRRALDEARTRFPEETHAELDQLTRVLVRKLLHHPSLYLRRGQHHDQRALEMVRELFQLDPEKEP